MGKFSQRDFRIRTDDIEHARERERPKKKQPKRKSAMKKEKALKKKKISMKEDNDTDNESEARDRVIGPAVTRIIAEDSDSEGSEGEMTDTDLFAGMGNVTSKVVEVDSSNDDNEDDEDSDNSIDREFIASRNEEKEDVDSSESEGIGSDSE